MSGYGMGNSYQPFTAEQISAMQQQQARMNAFHNQGQWSSFDPRDSGWADYVNQCNAAGSRPGQRQTVERISPADRATMRAEAVTATQIGPGQYEVAAWI